MTASRWSLAVFAAGAGLAGIAAAPAIHAQTEGPAHGPAAGEVRPQPGEYRANVEFQSADIPGAPPQVVNMLRKMMSREFTYCLTPEEVERGFRSVTDRSGEGECTYERFDATGGTIDAVVACDMDGRAMRVRMMGTGSPTRSDITMEMSGDMGMGDGGMTMRVRHERIGEC